MLLFNKLNRLGINGVDGMITRWKFLYFASIVSVVKNYLDAKEFHLILLQQKFLKYQETTHPLINTLKDLTSHTLWT